MSGFDGFKKLDLPFREIEAVAELLKRNDFTFIRDQAMQNWMKDMNVNGSHDMTPRAWTMAVLTVLNNHGFELKKKE